MFHVNNKGIVSVGVDYLRRTYERGKQEGVAEHRAELLSSRQFGHGHTVGVPRDWWFVGYRGWVCGAVAFGRRDADCIVQVSGCLATSAVEFLSEGINTSRIDLQLTVLVDDDVSSLIEAMTQAVLEARKGREGRAFGVRRIASYGDGDTLYVGSRQSEQFGRIYDKGTESGGDYPKGSLRFEVEYKGAWARRINALLMQAGCSGAVVAGLVRGFYEKRGLDISLSGESLGIDLGDTIEVEGAHERSMRWLRSQVAPAIARLLREGVAVEAVVEALGLGVEGRALVASHYGKLRGVNFDD